MRLPASGTAFWFIFFGVCFAAGQAAPPTGPYTSTCKNIRMKGHTLHADCQNVEGKAVPARLENAAQCAEGVINLNGGLSCQSGTIPPGSYLSSCDDPSVQGATLRAMCKDDKGRKMKAELRDSNRCVGDIANRNGSLRCVASEPSSSHQEKKKEKKKHHHFWPLKHLR
ncbi:MAG: hypothetical protein ACM3SW_05335 [Actinomycetota bacterium]